MLTRNFLALLRNSSENNTVPRYSCLPSRRDHIEPALIMQSFCFSPAPGESTPQPHRVCCSGRSVRKCQRTGREMQGRRKGCLLKVTVPAAQPWALLSSCSTALPLPVWALAFITLATNPCAFILTPCLPSPLKTGLLVGFWGFFCHHATPSFWFLGLLFTFHLEFFQKKQTVHVHNMEKNGGWVLYPLHFETGILPSSSRFRRHSLRSHCHPSSTNTL